LQIILLLEIYRNFSFYMYGQFHSQEYGTHAYDAVKQA